MGVHVSITHKTKGELPLEKWDWLRHAGDRKILGIITSIPHKCVSEDYEFDEYYRPKDVEQFRSALLTLNAKYENDDRWNTMCDILAGDKDLYLCFSY